MNSKFGNRYPVLCTKPQDRERFLLIAAAGLAFSLIIILWTVFQVKRTHAATFDQAASTEHLPVPPMTTVTVLTPERSIQAGTPMSAVTLKEAYWPRNQMPVGAVLDPDEIQGMTTAVKLTPGVPILREQLTKEFITEGLLPSKGNRAVTIPVDEVTSLESHARPGSYVDLILTYYLKRELTSKIIVQNSRVLSLGGKLDFKGARGSNVSTNLRTITLDVSPKDALEIQTAKKLGTLSLTMRHPEDHTPVKIDSHNATKIDGREIRPRKRRCTRGTVRINGEEFIANCDGTLTRIEDPLDP